MDYDKTLEQAAADTFWVPDDVEVRDRATIRYTVCNRPVELYNRVLFSFGSAADHEPLVDEVLQAHQGVPSTWTVTPSNDSADVRQLLVSRGYTQGNEHFAYVLECASYDRTGPDNVQVQEVETTDDLRTLYRTQNRGFGTDRVLSTDELNYEIDFCTGPNRRVVRYIAWLDGEAVGSGSMTLFPGLDFAMIWAGCVVPEARGRGIYTALIERRVAYARRHQIEALGLYAKVDTSAPIVAAQGFERYGKMTQFVRRL